MTSMTTMPWKDRTVDDLDALPDDGFRYELVDGVLLVSAAPSIEHQIALTNLVGLMLSSCPPQLRVLVAPVDVRFSLTRQLQPDLIVLADHGRGGPAARALPLLVVEVLSPTTRATDLTLKRHVFEQGGIA